MKRLKRGILLLLLAIVFTACSSVQVVTDYDKEVDFDQYQTFAYYKSGIDKAEISDLDKRRILKAIDKSMLEKGFTKSKEADLLISIYTDATKEVNVYPNYYGWYSPWWGYPGYYNRSSSYTKGTLYIDIIDRASKTLIWQGVGQGAINPEADVDKKTERINTIVEKIMEKYPPERSKK